MKKQAESLEALGAEIDVVPIRGYADSRAYPRAAVRIGVLNRRRYDLVHAHYGLSGVVARLYVRSPLVISYLGTDLLGARPDSGVDRRYRHEARIYSQLSRLSAATITQSHEMAALLPAATRGRNAVIAEGVDLSLFRPLDRTLARGRLGWPGDERVVLFVSDPSRPEKNFALAQAAWRRCRELDPSVTLRVASGVEPHDIPLWMAASDALIMTSRYEGGPSVVKEAMACELPVVSTPVGIVAEILRGAPGLTVVPPDPGALADALSAALTGGRMPAARAAIEIMSLERVALKVAGVYHTVLSR